MYLRLFFILRCWSWYYEIVRAGEPEPVGAECFWLLGAGAGAAWKKPGAGAAWEKKSGARAGAAWKKNREPEPEKNLPAPQPCLFLF